MPRKHTLEEMTTWCQQRADMEHGGAVEGTEEWQSLISMAYAELYGVVAESGYLYFLATYEYTTDGVGPYQEPSNHSATVQVNQITDTTIGTRRELIELMPHEYNRFRGATGTAIAWAFLDDQLHLFPNPPSGQTYELVYVPQPPDLTSYDPTTLIDVVTPDGEQFVIWSVAIAALAKEGTDTGLAERKAAEYRLKVENWANLRAFEGRRMPPMIDDGISADPGDWWNR